MVIMICMPDLCAATAPEVERVVMGSSRKLGLRAFFRSFGGSLCF